MRAIPIAAIAAFIAACAVATVTQAAAPASKQQVAAQDTSAPAGDYRKTTKDGPNSYRFEGSSGGCHFSGTVSPSGYHLDRAC